MEEWINAAQLYRHGQEQQEPAEPPMDFVIAHLSAGATYLRWMIELNCARARRPRPTAFSPSVEAAQRWVESERAHGDRLNPGLAAQAAPLPQMLGH
jgi:hypothetical protein